MRIGEGKGFEVVFRLVGYCFALLCFICLFRVSVILTFPPSPVPVFLCVRRTHRNIVIRNQAIVGLGRLSEC